MQIAVGSELTLTYDPRYSDELIVVGTVVKVWDDGDFDFQPADEDDFYTVLKVEVDQGVVTIDPKQIDG